eukprot:COSAG01_NODE_9_length_43729_cov_66.133463_7_plen_361_part_00
MGSSFGKLFNISTWGESHGGGVGVVIDGCPAGLNLCETDIQHDLDRRRPGQSDISTPRKEADQVEILSGVFEGKTLGTPIALLIRNKDANPAAYNHLKSLYRPSHADYTYDAKYGHRNWQGGGRASARETIGRVAAGAIAKKLLAQLEKITILGFVTQIHQIKAEISDEMLREDIIESNAVRCPDMAAASLMSDAIKTARKNGDALGGLIRCQCLNVPPGLGEPVFDKLKADLAKAMLSIPACMGFQIGSGFEATNMTAQTHNDAFYQEGDSIKTRSNFSGGMQGGISNGEPIYFDVVFKPTATVATEQDTVNQDGQAVKLVAKGRHDPCVLPRAVPIVEAMTALVLIDHLLRQRSATLN